MCPVLVINVLLTSLLIWLWIKATLKARDIVKAERAADAKKEQEEKLMEDQSQTLKVDNVDADEAGGAIQRNSALTATVASG